MNALEIIELCKTYAGDKKVALDNVSLQVKKGSIFGLLGRNGAGKSTLINIMGGLVRKTSGVARVWGYDVETAARHARLSIGIVPQELNLDAFFTPREALDMQAGLYGIPRRKRHTETLLEMVGLRDKADTYARRLSGGMRRRLMVAKAMVHRPPVLILDEPTAGVDVELRQALWESVRELNAMGVTILLTTHYLEEAQELCDTIAVLHQGHVVVCEDKTAFLNRAYTRTMTVSVSQDLEAVPNFGPDAEVTLEAPRLLTIRYAPQHYSVEKLLSSLSALAGDIIDLTVQESQLEEIFLQLTKIEERVG